MSNIYRLTIHAIVLLAALSIVLLFNFALFPADEEEPVESRVVEKTEDAGELETGSDNEDYEYTADPEETENGDAVEDADEAEFTVTSQPYRAYLEALESEKPVVLEFYAHT